MPEYTKVNVQVKVIDVKEPQVVGKSKKKQEVTIADQSDNAILTLWEEDIGSLELAQSYSITKLLVRVFNGDHYLSKPAHGSRHRYIHWSPRSKEPQLWQSRNSSSTMHAVL